MTTLRACGLLGFIGFYASFLAGCPDGEAGIHGQDGGADASDADAGQESGADVEAGASEASAAHGASKGSGALCGVDGRNDCGPFLLCDESLGCVECTHDDDCPVAAAHCLQGTCVGCRPAGGSGTSDCPTAATACWSTDDECHAPCSDASPCPSGSLCDKASGACAFCTQGSDCASGVCSPTRRTCVDCTSDETCPGSKPRCRVLTGTCEACTSSADCGHAAPVCDPTTFTCRVPVDAGATDAGSAADGS